MLSSWQVAKERTYVKVLCQLSQVSTSKHVSVYTGLETLPSNLR